MVQTPHLKFGSWNDSRVSTVFPVWIKPNILWICLRPTLKASTWLRPLLCVLFCIWSVCYVCWGLNEWQDITADPTHFSFLTIWPPMNTYIQKNAQFHLRQIDFKPFLCPHAAKAVPVPLYCVWFGSVFGLAFLRFAIQLFVFGFLCVSFFFCQDSLFLYLIKIWKLNFHSIFSNHLIKISSTTTKKIRSSCSK